MSKAKTVCGRCGSDKVSTLMWVDINTNEVIAMGANEKDDNWCDTCKERTRVIFKN